MSGARKQVVGGPPSSAPRMIFGVVLAGGASSRFGGTPKGLQLFRGRAMALWVADVLARVCERVVIEAPFDAGYEALGLPLVHADAAHAAKGPLAGIAAGLGAASAAARVVFAPCDMPLIGPEIYARLLGAGHGGAYAATAMGVEPLVAVMPREALGAVLLALAREPPRTHVVLDRAGLTPVLFDDTAPFANVNTPADLVRLGP